MVSLGDLQAASKTHVLDQALVPQAQARSPDMNSHTTEHGAAQDWGQDSKFDIIKVPGKGAAQSSVQMCPSPRKKPRLSLFQTPEKNMQTPDLGVFQTLQPRASPVRARQAVAPEVTGMTPPKEHSIDFHLPLKGLLLRTPQACLGSHPPPIDQVPGQPLRMVFRRLDGGQWSSSFMTVPSFPPAEKSSPPGHNHPISEKSEGQGTHVPWSILHDDLQVSSSSEESDGQ